MCTCLYNRHIEYVNSGVMKSKFYGKFRLSYRYIVFADITYNKKHESFFLVLWGDQLHSAQGDEPTCIIIT